MYFEGYFFAFFPINLTSKKPTNTDKIIRIEKECSYSLNGICVKFIPKKLATKVGTIKMIVMTVSLWIKVLRLFDIIEA